MSTEDMHDYVLALISGLSSSSVRNHNHVAKIMQHGIQESMYICK